MKGQRRKACPFSFCRFDTALSLKTGGKISFGGRLLGRVFIYSVCILPMPNKFIFADEAGCFTFNREPNVSRYFILCTVVMDRCDVAASLLDLRRELAWRDEALGDYFHATTDKQSVRDKVFQTIGKHDFSVQATIMEKSKAHPQVRHTKPGFYQFGFFYHFKFGLNEGISGSTELLLTTASLGNRRERAAFQAAVHDAMRQTSEDVSWKTDFMPAHADPCLQVADYCAWAIQRKWERNDERSYLLIKDRITYERDLWAKGDHHYY